MGTAVVPFGTPVENVPDVKQAGLDAASPWRAMPDHAQINQFLNEENAGERFILAVCEHKADIPTQAARGQRPVPAQ